MNILLEKFAGSPKVRLILCGTHGVLLVRFGYLNICQSDFYKLRQFKEDNRIGSDLRFSSGARLPKGMSDNKQFQVRFYLSICLFFSESNK